MLYTIFLLFSLLLISFGVGWELGKLKANSTWACQGSVYYNGQYYHIFSEELYRELAEGMGWYRSSYSSSSSSLSSGGPNGPSEALQKEII